MKPRPKARRSWSLQHELYVIESAVDGARILVELVAYDQAATEHDHRAAPVAAAAVLTLVELRVRELGRVLRGEVKPGSLRAAHNACDGEPAAADVVFTARE